jgi:GDP-D-mannose dehydratase
VLDFSHATQIITLVQKELLNYMKHSNSIRLLLQSISAVTFLLLHFIHSIQIIILALKEQSKYLKHSNQIHPSQLSNLAVPSCFLISFSLNTDNNIDSEGITKLSEALKSNTSLSSLVLASNTFGSLHLILIQCR